MVRRLARALWNWLLELPLAVRDGVSLARRRSNRMLWLVRDAASEAPFVLRDRLTALVTSPLHLRRMRGVVLVAAVPLLPAVAAFLVLTGRQADRATAAGPVAYRVVPDRPSLPGLPEINAPEAARKAASKRRPLNEVRAQPTPPQPLDAHLVTRPTAEATQAAPPTPRVTPPVSKPRAEPRPDVPAKTAETAYVPTRTVPAGTVVAEAPAAVPTAAPASAPATVPREEPRERPGRRGHDDEEKADDEQDDNSGKGKGDDDEEDEEEDEEEEDEEDEEDDKSGKGKGDDEEEDEDDD